MPTKIPTSGRIVALATWPFGIGLTSWRYMWRTTPMTRGEEAADLADHAPPELPEGFDRHQVQTHEAGTGPLFHRLYRSHIHDPQISAMEVMARVQGDPNVIAPTEFARFHRLSEGSDMRFGDDYVVHMPGPWNGPVRVVDVCPTSFRFATLDGHLEAGQIEFRADDRDGLRFEIESWARSGDRLSRIMYDGFRMAKEVQLHMWTSSLEQVVRLSGGKRKGRIEVATRRVEMDG
jgi:hypothetical protein